MWNLPCQTWAKTTPIAGLGIKQAAEEDLRDLPLYPKISPVRSDKALHHQSLLPGRASP